jgi:KUP system potassium uptake protein
LAQRIAVQRIDGRFQPARLNLGFMDKPNITDTIAICRDRGLPCDPASTTFFLGRETVRPTKGAPMALWRQHLFIGLSRIASSRAAYFNMPPNRVVELGVQLNL